MRIKSYFAQSVQEAIERARIELGPDAMLMNSRKTDPELRQLGAYEVVFGLADNGAPEPSHTRAQAQLIPSSDILIQEIAELKKQIETVKRSVSRTSVQQQPGVAVRKPSELEELFGRLCAANFSEDLAHEMLHVVESRIWGDKQNLGRALQESGDGGTLRALSTALIEEIENRFQVSPGFGSIGADSRILMLVGPPGAGKTTTLVKLAMRYGIATRTPVQILSADTLRIGGSDQLAAYARIIGVGFQAVHSAASLATALEEYRSKRLILIDTPGYSAGNIQDAGEWTHFLASQPQIDVQLVIPAFLRYAAATRIHKRFTAFQPSKLIFSHFDEAETVGAVLELAMKTKLPVSYISPGQQIPEDLEEASKSRLTAKLSDFAPSAALSAA